MCGAGLGRGLSKAYLFGEVVQQQLLVIWDVPALRRRRCQIRRWSGRWLCQVHGDDPRGGGVRRGDLLVNGGQLFAEALRPRHMRRLRQLCPLPKAHQAF
jgi:hypothetical protein